PQNRNRCYMVSVLGNYYYEFPSKIKLKLRLKDMLEDEVDEKYYINADYDLINSENQAGNLKGGKWDKINESCRRFYDIEKIAPTIHTMGGGNTEPKIATRLSKTLEKNSIEDGDFIDSYNQIIRKGISGTITTRVSESNNTFVAVPEKTKRGYAEAHVGDGVYIDRPHQKREVVQKGMIQTIKTSGDDVGVVVKGNYSPSGHIDSNLRIRKLTPKECWRLMGFSDEDFEKASKVNSNSQLYKQAGNSIVVNVLEEIFKMLF
ncbi:MAG TPA: DNA cytosine methyltransferase, partial [Bacilli bacterium]|nr:DNA cytosine methyltransferase [Bacilli bacterium]